MYKIYCLAQTSYLIRCQSTFTNLKKGLIAHLIMCHMYVYKYIPLKCMKMCMQLKNK